MGWWGRLAKAPWTLWACVVLSLVPFGVISGAARIWSLPITLLFGLVVGYSLLRGNRYMWWFLVVAGAGGIPLSFPDDWRWGIPRALVMLALLLVPPSRRYVFPPMEPKPGRACDPSEAVGAFVPAAPAAAVGSSPPRQLSEWDPAMDTDAERPAGWYFAPGDLRRMRYWDPEGGVWRGNARVPGRIRRRAERAAAE